MAQFSLSSHRFTIIEGGKRKRDNIDYEIMDSVGKSSGKTPIDFYQILTDNLPLISEKDEKNQKIYRFEISDKDNAKRMFSGLIKAGDFGYEADILNVDDESKKKKRETRDAELIPYYYLIHLPKDSTYGYIILQRFQKSGIQTIFFDALKQIVQNNVDRDEVKYRIDSGNCFTRELFLEILNNSRIKEITAVKTYVTTYQSNDKADRLSDKSKPKKETEIKDYVVKTSIQPHQKSGTMAKLVNNITSLIRGQNEIGDDLLKSMGVDKYDELTIHVKHNMMDRTIKIYDKSVRLDHNNQLFPYIDITQDVKTLKGHPEFNSIDKFAKNHLDSILNGKDMIIESYNE